jgi:4-hydroxy-tetrahydrodipicolinate synthase
MKKLGRCLTAMVTPFTESGEVDYALALLDSGNDGLVVAATTGEAPTLTWDEELRMFEVVKSAVGDHGTIVAYTGSNSTSEAVEATRDAEKIGVDAYLSVVPYYNKPTQEGIYQHFRAVAESTSLPIIMYNIPSRVVVNMTPDTIARLSQIDNIVGVKEANGDMIHVAETINKAREDFCIWSGNDNDTFAIIALGGYGTIGVVTHLVGKQVKKMMELILDNNVREAAVIHRHLVPLVNALFIQPNPGPVKYALNQVGMRVGAPRLPLLPPDDKTGAAIMEVVNKYTIDIKA